MVMLFRCCICVLFFMGAAAQPLNDQDVLNILNGLTATTTMSPDDCKRWDPRVHDLSKSCAGILNAFNQKTTPTKTTTSSNPPTSSTNSFIRNLNINRILSIKNTTAISISTMLPNMTSPILISRNFTSNADTTTPKGNYAKTNFTFVTDCAVFPACTIVKLPPEANALYAVECDRHLVGFILALIIILDIAIIASNIMIIFVVAATPALRRPHGYFKMSLAIADFITGIFVLPAVANNILNNISYDASDKHLAVQSVVVTDAASITFVIAGMLSAISTIYSLLLLSVDSYLSIRWPMKYRIGEIMTTKRAAIAIILVWILAVAVAILPALVPDYVDFTRSLVTMFYMPFIKPLQVAETEPHYKKFLHVILYAVIIWGIPFVVTWFLTLLTWVHSRKMLLQMKDSRRQSTRTQNSLSRVDRDLRRTTTVVLVLFTVTVLPVFAVLIDQTVQDPGPCKPRAQGDALFASTFIMICGSFLNVIVYNTCNKEFREATAILVKDIAGCLKRIRPSRTRTAVASKRPTSYWQSPAGRELWKSRYAGDASINSSKSLRTLSGESQATAVTTTRTRSTSSAGSDTLKNDLGLRNSMGSVMEETGDDIVV